LDSSSRGCFGVVSVDIAFALGWPWGMLGLVLGFMEVFRRLILYLICGFCGF